MSFEIRKAEPGDAEAVAAIHAEAVLAGNATFRSEPRPVADVESGLRSDQPFLVAFGTDGRVLGWASTGPYEESNPYYDGVGDVAVYVASKAQGQGIGQSLLEALDGASAEGGKFKLVAKVFSTNEASLRLFERAGYTAVGTHHRHGRLRGEWKDVVVLERLLGEAAL